MWLSLRKTKIPVVSRVLTIITFARECAVICVHGCVFTHVDLIVNFSLGSVGSVYPSPPLSGPPIPFVPWLSLWTPALAPLMSSCRLQGPPGGQGRGEGVGGSLEGLMVSPSAAPSRSGTGLGFPIGPCPYFHNHHLS